jgi:hypothetical protein
MCTPNVVRIRLRSETWDWGRSWQKQLTESAKKRMAVNISPAMNWHTPGHAGSTALGFTVLDFPNQSHGRLYTARTDLVSLRLVRRLDLR